MLVNRGQLQNEVLVNMKVSECNSLRLRRRSKKRVFHTRVHRPRNRLDEALGGKRLVRGIRWILDRCRPLDRSRPEILWQRTSLREGLKNEERESVEPEKIEERATSIC